jgi:replication initiator protein
MAKNEDQSLLPIGKTAEFEALTKNCPKPSRALNAFVDAVAAIHQDPDAADTAFLTRLLVFCTLPHSNPAAGKTKADVEPSFKRETGNQKLEIVPDGRYGYPYGVLPRLVLYWIATEVQYTKDRKDMTSEEKRTLFLGRRLNDFLRAIGLNPNTGGGKRGDSRRLHDQMMRLFKAKISFELRERKGTVEGLDWEDMLVTEKGELWWDIALDQPEQMTLWSSWIRISESFYKALLYKPLPLDLRALRALKRSPLALDLYAWICYSAGEIIEKQKGPQFASWSQLQDQLGAEYKDSADFKKAARPALAKIKSLYPGLTITSKKGGFILNARRLAVPRRAPKMLNN